MHKVFGPVVGSIDRGSRLLGIVSAGFAFVLVGVVTYGVIMRYVFRSPTAYSIELPELMFIAIIAFCLGYAQIYGRHIRVDSFTSRLPRKLQKAFSIFTGAVTVGYCGIVIWALWQRFTLNIALNDVTRESRVPFAPFALAIIIGIAFLGLQVIIDTITGRQAKHEHKADIE